MNSVNTSQFQGQSTDVSFIEQEEKTKCKTPFKK